MCGVAVGGGGILTPKPWGTGLVIYVIFFNTNYCVGSAETNYVYSVACSHSRCRCIVLSYIQKAYIVVIIF